MHQSPNDTNQYRRLILNNGLTVLLIHAPQNVQAAAALAVNVGHFDDPKQRQGLAHYLEHMLFLGSQEYPKMNEFHTFIHQYGGEHNAWTGTEHSCFFFDIEPDAFLPALTRFSRFFIDPLFHVEALEKEVQAVDAEYQLKINDEIRRQYQVQKETINPKHPFAQFSVGNATTLACESFHHLRQELIAFYQQHYSADLMSLVLMSNHSLDKLAHYASTLFGQINNQHLAPKQQPIPFVTAKETGIFIHSEPLKEQRTLTLTFPLPNNSDYYQTKPITFLAHLLGYEGKNSLLSQLKRWGWVEHLLVSRGLSGNSFQELMLRFQLTTLGLKRIDDIIQASFQQLRLIEQHGLTDWRYAEKKNLLATEFQFQEAFSALDTVSHLAMNLHHYQAEDVIYGDYKMQGLDKKQLTEIFHFLTPRNLRVSLIAKSGHYDHTAQWYFTPYSVRPLSSQQLSYYQRINPNLSLNLPEKNPFISQRLAPKPIEKPEQTQPQILQDLEGFRLWHWQDNSFSLPKGVIYVAIDSPYAVSSPYHITLLHLCVELLLDALSEESYDAELAGIDYQLYVHQGGVTLLISGLSEKQPELLELILTRFAQRQFNASRFNAIKHQLTQHWTNAAKNKPISQLFNQLTGLLQPHNPTYSCLLEALHSVTLDALAPFVEAILAQLHVEMFVFGDWRPQEAHHLAHMLKTALKVPNQKYQASPRPLLFLGDQGSYQHEVFCQQNDAAIMIYYQSAQLDPQAIALYLLANHLMSAAFFHEIRTKQQLGYMVGTGNMPLNRYPGLVLYVQSPHTSPQNLMSAIDEFLNAFYLVLLELNEEQWQDAKAGLEQQIASPDLSLTHRAQRLWVAIGHQDFNFNQQQQVLDALKKINRETMLRFVVQGLKPRTANRLILFSQGAQGSTQAPLNAGKPIKNWQQVRQSCSPPTTKN